MKPYYISNWKEWEELCLYWGHDPYQVIEFSIDEGGGNSTNFEYIGDIPEREE